MCVWVGACDCGCLCEIQRWNKSERVFDKNLDRKRLSVFDREGHID